MPPVKPRKSRSSTAYSSSMSSKRLLLPRGANPPARSSIPEADELAGMKKDRTAPTRRMARTRVMVLLSFRGAGCWPAAETRGEQERCHDYGRANLKGSSNLHAAEAASADD